jgi:subfamily B ATP-binding cassette protein MsbA
MNEGARAGAAEDLPAQPDRRGDWKIYRRLLRYVAPYWWLFVIAIAGYAAGGAAEAYFLKLFGELIDGWQNHAVEVARTLPLLMLGAAVVRGLGEIVGELLLSRISFAVVHRIRTQLFDQLLLMPSAYFDASSQGHLVSRLTYNVGQLRDTGADALKSVIQDGAKVAIYFGYMLWLSWKLTLIFAATAPLVAIVVVYASRRFRRLSRRIQNSMGDVTHVASEAVSGYRVVRIFAGEEYERERFHRSSDSNQRQNLKMVATKVTSTQVIQVFVAAALSILVALLLQPEIAGDLSTGQIVTLLGLAGMLARPVRKLTEVNARLQRGLAAAEDIFGQMDQSAERDAGTLDVDRVAGRIEFRHLGFAYERGGVPVLEDVNLIIEPGQTVALVGKSGSGKSTLASLIPRFYEPTSGSVLLDGRPLDAYRLAALRRQIALVTQQVTLFNDTLERNIAYGALAEAPPEAIRSAIERAHADVFIDEMENGLATLVGDDGVLLSGGQRQRIAIARALLKDAPILILDEATSALDNESERHIQAALEEVMRGRTTLVIAHRLSTIERADVIVVMDAGRIVESGTHSELLARRGAYASLYDAEFAESAAPREPSRAVPGSDERPQDLPRSAARRSTGALRARFRAWLEARFVDAWYGEASWPRLLAPLAWFQRRGAARRRLDHLTGRRTVWRAPVPVVVVGNVTVGGTGKTPFVIWLVEHLRALGHRPGIVSRGHGGTSNGSAERVSAASDPARVGDEPVLLAVRTGCPVWIGHDRAAAVGAMLAADACTVVVADDGLQHYGLGRDFEIAVLDGQRLLGNGRSLPAGPLREPAERLQTVDWRVICGVPAGVSGVPAAAVAMDAVMRIRPVAFVDLVTRERLEPAEFCERHPAVDALAGIGNPARFAATLRELGIAARLQALPDHYRFTAADIVRSRGAIIVCTEKDAVKLRRLPEFNANAAPGQWWYLEIEVDLDAVACADLDARLRRRGIVPATGSQNGAGTGEVQESATGTTGI